MSRTPVVSDLLAAGLIVHVRIRSEEFGPWRDDDVPVRTGTLRIEVVEILKGRLTAPAGATAEVAVVERGGDSAVLDYYGIWSQVSTAAGTELVGFCDGATAELGSQLTDEHCSTLLPADSVLTDLHLAFGLLSRHLTVDQLLAEAGRLRSQAGARFARFVWVQVRDAVVASPERFDALMRIAEDPATRTEAQDAYLRAAYEDATVTESLTADQRARLARAMFRTALDPAQNELRDHLLTTFLPNLVTAPVPEPLSSDQVFEERRELVEQVRADEQDESTSTYDETLSRWLRPPEDGG